MNRKEFLIISIVVFLSVVAWMIIDIYHVKNQPEIEREIKPVQNSNFKIDSDVLNILEQKK